MQQPSLNEFYRVEQSRLRAKLDSVRFAISHAGEKGRVLEKEAFEFIRSMLPSEYGLSSGFIAYCERGTVGLSQQLDLIIYDAVRCAPLVDLGACKVFPLEAVYGYVEIKSSLNAKTLSLCVSQNIALRELTQRNFWESVDSSPPDIVRRSCAWLPIRSFVFSFESCLGTGQQLAQKLRKALDGSPAGRPRLHGIFVAGNGFFSPYRIDDESSSLEEYRQEFLFETENALTAFKIMLFRCLATFPRYEVQLSPAIDLYHQGLVQLSEGA